jgi:cytochrome c553
MRRLTTLASILTGAVIALALTQAHAAGGVTASLSSGKSIFEQGKGTVPACTTCHGDDGMGSDLMGAPRLAGQIAEYTLKQLEDFASDVRMDTTMFIMNANAKGLTQQDRRDVAAYLSTLGRDRVSSAAGGSDIEALASDGVEVGESYLGLRLVAYGAPERGIPACRSCHDFNGRGVEPIYPMIGQQKYNYLVNQLKHFRDGSRSNDVREQMQKVARKLSDEDIRNVATYLTNASPFSMGNNRLPPRNMYIRFEE